MGTVALVQLISTGISNLTGIAVTKKHLYVSTGVFTSTVYKLDLNGIAISSFSYPVTISGMCWNGKNLCIINVGLGTLDIVNENGVLIKQFELPNATMGDVCFDGKYFWTVNNFLDMVYQLSEKAVEITSFSLIGGTWNGICTDGKNIYLMEDGKNNLVQAAKDLTTIDTFPLGTGVHGKMDFNGKHVYALRGTVGAILVWAIVS